jgi:hypothetical protein
LASDGAANDYFGISVAVSGNSAIIGAFGDDSSTRADQGSAYIFSGFNADCPGTMCQVAKLVAWDEADSVAGSKYMGLSVALRGNTAVVGSFQDDLGTGTNQGSAYVFSNASGSWSPSFKLTAPN